MPDYLGRGEKICQRPRQMEDCCGSPMPLQGITGISQSDEDNTYRPRGKWTDLVKSSQVLQEKNSQFKSKDVIVMKLCERGSLLDLKRKPENITGLEEEEFLRVFSHLVSGMKHLRKHGFSHRDIKPGNILVCLGEDGKNIYKLSDFGTAKPLNDNELFVSLVGTDEYLHPDIYKAAFIDRRKGGGTFTIAVDLWSLGATLYHTVTGKVPFNPYVGRDDKDVMFEMISEKGSGVISGEQVSAGGSIHWKTDLPKTCRLSSCMNTSIRTILMNLLESDKAKIWSFEEFFDAADELLSRKPVYMFYPHTCLLRISYIKEDTSFRELKDLILSESCIPCDQQYILYRDNVLTDMISDTDIVIQNICTNFQNPLIVMDTSISCDKKYSICYEPWEKVVFDEPMPRFELTDRTIYDIPKDCQVAKVLCAKMFLMEKLTKRLETFRKVLLQAVWISRKLQKQKVDKCSRDLAFLRKRLGDIKILTEHSKKDKFTAINRDGNEADDDFSMTKKRLENCEKLLSEVLTLHKKEKNTCTFLPHSSCHHCQETATDSGKKIRRHIEQAEELLKKFIERRSQRLTVHLEYMHNFDRKNIQNHSKEIQNLMNKSNLELQREHSEFLSWNRHHVEEKMKITELNECLTETSSSVDDLVQTLKELHSQEPPLPAIGEKTLKRKQFIKDVKLRVDNMQKDISESKLLAVQSREQLDSLSSLMSDLPDLEDVDYMSISNGTDSLSDSKISFCEDSVDFNR